MLPVALLQDAIFLSIGVVLITAGGYFLWFRPIERRLALLAAYFLAQGAWYFAFVGWPDLDLATMFLALVSSAILFIFLALTPTPLRPRGWVALAYALALVWVVGAVGYLASGRWTHEGPRDAIDGLFAPGFLGAAFPSLVFLILRLRELSARTDAAATGLGLMLVGLQARLLVAAGLVAAQTALAFGGRGLYPFFLYEPTPLSLTFAFLAYYALGAGLITLFEWRHSPTRLGIVLLLAGALSALPLATAPPGAMSTAYARSWSFIAEPAIVLYAQARYGVFGGEPTAVRPTLLVTALSGLFTYLFAFGVVATLLPEEIATIVAPIAALVAALGVALVVLPRARKAQLRHALSPGPAGEPTSLAPGAILVDRYRVERFLAEGGQGRVFEATDRNTGRRVVLKALASDAAAAEARLLSRFRHTNIVRFVEILEVTGRTLLVIEHAPGGDLRAHLARRGGRLDVDEALRMMDGILAGLGEAHAHGVAHRDVKPENILLDAQGVPKIADFGAARDATPGATVRVGGLATVAYLAPEQVRGDPGDARTDVYALGVLIHEMVTGERPIPSGGRDDFLLRRAIVAEAPRITLPAAMAALAPMLERALAKDPAARFQDAREMHAALSAARLEAYAGRG